MGRRPKAAQWLLARTLPRLNAVITNYGQPPIRELFEVLDRCNRVQVMTSPHSTSPKQDYLTMSATSVPNSTAHPGRPSKRGDGPVANRSSWWRPAQSSNIKPACCSRIAQGPRNPAGPRPDHHWPGR